MQYVASSIYTETMKSWSSSQTADPANKICSYVNQYILYVEVKRNRVVLINTIRLDSVSYGYIMH